MTLSQRLRAANGGAWDEMQAHRFVRDIEADALPPAVFRRYLVYESAVGSARPMLTPSAAWTGHEAHGQPT